MPIQTVPARSPVSVRASRIAFIPRAGHSHNLTGSAAPSEFAIAFVPSISRGRCHCGLPCPAFGLLSEPVLVPSATGVFHLRGLSSARPLSRPWRANRRFCCPRLCQTAETGDAFDHSDNAARKMFQFQ
jgi:hypothetical protein